LFTQTSTPTPFGDDAIGEGLDGFAVAGVSVHEDAVHRRIPVQRDAGDAGAGLREGLRNPFADAARRPGDDHAPVAHIERR
jgi:hypothetical protein